MDSPEQGDLLQSEVQGGVLQQNWTRAPAGSKVMSGNGWGQGRGARRMTQPTVSRKLPWRDLWKTRRYSGVKPHRAALPADLLPFSELREKRKVASSGKSVPADTRCEGQPRGRGELCCHVRASFISI